jgi:hypothetical protein
MKKCLLVFVALILILSVHSCIFTDQEIYYFEPLAGDPPLLSIASNLDTLSAPTVIDSLEINYQVSVENGAFYYVYAEVNELTVYESDSTEGSFWLHSSDAEPEGSDILFFELYYSTNSNSLADILEYEALDTLISYAINFNPEVLK